MRHGIRCCDLDSGKLRSKISVERETLTKDSVGGQQSTWTRIYFAFAWIRPVSGFERVQAQKLEADITHDIFIRFTKDLKPQDRIIYNDRIMQIRAVLNVEERNQWLRIKADEGPVT